MELAKAHAASERLPMTKAVGAEAATEALNTMSGEEFLAKALEAVSRKHFSTGQLTESELCLREGRLPPPATVKAVLNGTPYWPF